MSWFELLLSIHTLCAALWFGSGLAVTVIAYRLLSTEGPAFGPYAVAAGWWAGRAHPAAAVVLLIAGILMVIDADISFGELWITLAFIGWIALMAIGGALIGRTSAALSRRIEGGDAAGGEDPRTLASRLLLYSRIETALLALIIVDMVVKPG